MGADREAWLVLKAQAGDRDAPRELLSLLTSPLRGYLTRLMGGREGVEDLVQASLVLVWRKLDQLAAPSLIRPWAYRIASRQAFRKLQRDRREREMETAFLREAELAESSATPPPPDRAEALLALLPSLASGCRAVLALHYEQGLKVDAVAEVLGLPPGTVKSRLAYGLRALRRLAAELPDANRGAAP